MTREQAALLLGVDCNADARQVHRAWRVWARLAHPDAGGDRDHFEALARARAVLLGASPRSEPVASGHHVEPVVTPRPRFRQVCRRPGPVGVLAVVAACVAAVLGSVMSVRMPDAGAAFVLGVTACAVALTVERASLQPWADPGHRIALLAGVWFPIAIVSGVVATVMGTDLLPVLPVLAVPFVAVIALVDPGAGLWRPVRIGS